ncbi:MAG: PAS domain-containing sensor histidine kinase [Bacteroidota bacterium]
MSITRNETAEIKKLRSRVKELEERNKILENEKSNMNRFLNRIPIGLYITTSDGKIKYVNQALANMLGFDNMDDLLERNLQKEGYEPSYSREQFKTILEEKGELNDYESRWKKKDGNDIDIRENSIRVKDPCCHENSIYYGIAEDITKRKKVEKQLQQSEKKYRDLFNYMWNGFALHELILDDQGNPVNFRYLDVNPGFEKLLNMPREKIVNKTVKELFPAVDNEWIDDYAEVALHGKTKSFERYNAFLDKHYKVMVFSPGKNKFAVLYTEISDLKRAEARLRESEESLKNINKTKDRLFSIIGHDLRNPVNSIKGFSEMIISNYPGKKDEQCFRFMDIINKEADRAHILLENLMEWARTQTNEIRFKPGHHKINLVIRSMISFYQTQIKEKNLRINNQLSNELTAFIDLKMTETIFRNLISNAIKFSNDYGSISVSSKEREGFVDISVTDTGMGIQEEILKKIFQVSHSKVMPGTHNEKGSGMGLILCKELVEINGGLISVRSELGKGSTFTVSLPTRDE